MHYLKKYTLTLITIIPVLTGCSALAQLASVGASHGAMPLEKPKKFDGPPQVIYRIDDHRYFTIRNYENCMGHGDFYYHDENKNLTTFIDDFSVWPGEYHIEPDDEIIVFPVYVAGDYGRLVLFKSENDGKSFERLSGTRSNFAKQSGVYNHGKDVFYAKDSETYRKPTLFKFDFSTGHMQEVKKLPAIQTPSGQGSFACDTDIRGKEIKE